jgi:hypothetical protein
MHINDDAGYGETTKFVAELTARPTFRPIGVNRFDAAGAMLRNDASGGHPNFILHAGVNVGKINIKYTDSVSDTSWTECADTEQDMYFLRGNAKQQSKMQKGPIGCEAGGYPGVCETSIGGTQPVWDAMAQSFWAILWDAGVKYCPVGVIDSFYPDRNIVPIGSQRRTPINTAIPLVPLFGMPYADIDTPGKSDIVLYSKLSKALSSMVQNASGKKSRKKKN